jgi:hypothetical protein
MQGRELFGVALRVFGVWFLIQAGVDTVFLLLRTNDVLNGLRSQVTQDKLFIGYYILLAIILIGLADPVVRLVYGPSDKRT